MNELIRTDNNLFMMQAAEQQAHQKAAMMEKAASMKNMDRINEAAKEFEAVFLTEMFKPMFEEVNEPDPLFGGGPGERVFNGFMVQEYGKLMAESGGIGIAEHVKAELIKIQEAQSASEKTAKTALNREVRGE